MTTETKLIAADLMAQGFKVHSAGGDTVSVFVGRRPAHPALVAAALQQAGFEPGMYDIKTTCFGTTTVVAVVG